MEWLNNHRIISRTRRRKVDLMLLTCDIGQLSNTVVHQEVVPCNISQKQTILNKQFGLSLLSKISFWWYKGSPWKSSYFTMVEERQFASEQDEEMQTEKAVIGTASRRLDWSTDLIEVGRSHQIMTEIMSADFTDHSVRDCWIIKKGK